MYSTLVSALVTSALLLGAAFGVLALADLDLDATEDHVEEPPEAPREDSPDQRGSDGGGACGSDGAESAAPSTNATPCE